MIVVIVAGGDIDIEFTRGFINEWDESSLFIIACDRGYEACEAMGIKPDLVVGDFDSADNGCYERAVATGVEVRKLNPVKDDTDAEAALDIAFTRTAENDDIYLLGATGTRIDHLLGNIGLIGKGLKNHRAVKLVDSHNYLEMIEPGEAYVLHRDDQFGKYVSVYPFMSQVKGLNMRGFKYPVENGNIDGFSTLTISNELVADSGEISIQEGCLIVMQTRD